MKRFYFFLEVLQMFASGMIVLFPAQLIGAAFAAAFMYSDAVFVPSRELINVFLFNASIVSVIYILVRVVSASFTDWLDKVVEKERMEKAKS